MTPVPSLARRRTRAASERPRSTVGDRVPCLGTVKRFFFASSTALEIARRNLARLAVTNADAVDLVADHDERGEREPAAALDDLGDAVDLDHALLELFRCPCIPCSKLQSSFARAVGERLDASVVEVAAAVEDGG